MCTYHAWFGTDLPEEDHWEAAPAIAANNVTYSHLVSLLKLRTNSHHLDIERLRQVTPRVPRSRRTCPWCRSPDALHDEKHCIMECPHLSQTRAQYPALFGPGTELLDMRALFTAENLVGPLASFVQSLPKADAEQPGTAST